jgi:hypothetical protein
MAGFILYVSSNNAFIPFHAKFLATTVTGVMFLAKLYIRQGLFLLHRDDRDDRDGAS